jgi:hypothetical protein
VSFIIDLKTLGDASGSVITLARLIRNFLRAIYEEAMVLYLIHIHNNLATDVYRGDPVCGCDMSLALAARAQKVAKAARGGPGHRPPRRGNRFSMIRVDITITHLLAIKTFFLFNNTPRPRLVPAPGD